jgi:hypothetical protein
MRAADLNMPCKSEIEKMVRNSWLRNKTGSFLLKDLARGVAEYDRFRSQFNIHVKMVPPSTIVL